MDIEIIEQPQSRLQVVIKCTQADEEVLRLKNISAYLTKKLLQKKIIRHTIFLPPTYCTSSP